MEDLKTCPLNGRLEDLNDSEFTAGEWCDKNWEGLKKRFEKNGTLDLGGQVNVKPFEERGRKQVNMKK